MQALSRSGPESPAARGRWWIHALSVGEVLSAEPLVKALAQKNGARSLIFTASTQTGFEMAIRLIAPHVSAVRHFPYDTLFSVNRALNVIRPCRVVIVETDIWPNFLHRLKKRRIPVYLVNARLSDRSFHGYTRIGWLMAPLLSVFGRICVQTDADRLRFRALGVADDRLMTVGNIKFDQAPARMSTAEKKQLAQKFNLSADAPVWVAGSTHEGEEEILSIAYRKASAAGIHAVLIVAPRDPDRAAAVCQIFSRSGYGAVTLSQMEKQPAPSSVVVIDRIGMLRRLYALADVAFVGGSLVSEGGHNPLEPASVAKPILFGPHTDDFRWICQTLEKAGGAMRVHDADQLAEWVVHLIANQADSRRVGRCAYGVFAKHRGAVERTLAAIDAPVDSVDP
ncbi:3-deoxy-D-manno-octulosonic acid transferase [Desulfosarcina sp.]|uniref:3-deoxy-D-manno-octulosonic acid transferase n=1 Tax=Desulfosarcina sp. TaxID=2027861 RepID=UPI0035679881